MFRRVPQFDDSQLSPVVPFRSPFAHVLPKISRKRRRDKKGSSSGSTLASPVGSSDSLERIDLGEAPSKKKGASSSSSDAEVPEGSPTPIDFRRNSDGSFDTKAQKDAYYKARYLKALEDVNAIFEDDLEEEEEEEEEDPNAEVFEDAKRVSGRLSRDVAREEAMDRAADIWKHGVKGYDWRPVNPKTHRCESSECEVEKISFAVFATREKKKWHVCVEGMCHEDRVVSSMGPNDPHAHAKRIQLVGDEHLYVCTRTAIPHKCGEWCDREVYNADNCSVCPVTGLMSKTVNARSKFWTASGGEWKPSGDIHPVRYRKARFVVSKKATLYPLLDVDVLFENSEAYRDKGDAATARELEHLPPPRSARDAKRRAWVSVYLRMSCIFSDERFVHDLVQNRKIRDDISSTLGKYICQCNQHSIVVNASEMRTITESKLAKSCDAATLDLDAGERTALVAYYTNKCLALWYVLVTKTREGKDNPCAFPFEEFVTASLHVFETGLKIHASDLGYDHEILLRDEFLYLCPVTEWVEKELHSRITDLKRRNNVLKRASDKITNAIHDAVVKDGVNPEAFDVSEMIFFNMDEEVFFRPQKRKNAKKKKRRQDREDKKKREQREARLKAAPTQSV